ncbi:MAG: Protein of unknown function (DUF1664) [Rhodobacteraceae bacterium HLUCCO18]|nr:MAG: Protein of unknown function (DUF1664) [Rhodobacteraceae bacterium HLUCCO18]
MSILMSYAADLLLVTASLGAAAYCMVLSRRLTRLGSFDKGIGNAIAILSAQVDEMKAALDEAKAGSDGAGQHLNDLVRQAQDISAELEMMIAACHDFAETAIQVQNNTSEGPGGHDTEKRADDALAEIGVPLTADASTMPGDEGNTGHATSGDAVPVFGSRRNASPQDVDGDAVPMFRHRSGTGA